MDGESELYDSYVDLKGWGARQEDDFGESEAFFGPFIPAGSRVLEIGFGPGLCMRWLRSRGCAVAGTELIPALRKQAEADGFPAYDGLESVPGPFDAILAVDVFEHLTISQLSAMLTDCRKLLAPGGVVVAKFPNGASPFSAYYQSGDATHLKPLSARALSQIAEPLGFSTEAVLNPRYLGRGGKAKLKNRIRFALRDLVQRFIGTVYFGRQFPMDPNVICVLKAR